METARAGNFNINNNVSLGDLYTLTGNDVTIYFRLAANRINMLILGGVWGAISR